MFHTAILSAIYGFYNTVFHPLLAAGPYVSLGFFSAVLAAVFSVIYWYFLDIEKANKIKDKLSDHQEKMKKAQKENDSDKASDHLEKTLKLNQKFMMLNMRPMIGTMVFVALFFPWLGATYAPAIDLDNSSGTYTGNLTYAQQTAVLEVHNKTVEYQGQNASVSEQFRALGVNWEVQKIDLENNKLKLNAHFVSLPFTVPFVGDALNWLGFYILIAMPLTYVLRKAMGVA